MDCGSHSYWEFRVLIQYFDRFLVDLAVGAEDIAASPRYLFVEESIYLFHRLFAKGLREKEVVDP